MPPVAAPAATPARPAFRLLRYFSIASLVALLLATAALTALQQRLAEKDLIRGQEYHHVVLTQSMAHGHWSEFSALFASAKTINDAGLQSHPEVARLRELVLREFTGTQVIKVKIYDRDGRTVFSTEARQIGEDKSANAGFRAALGGVPASELTHRNEFSAFEQKVENIDVVSSYVPVRQKDRSEVEAVFEIYSDISPLLARVRETRNAVALQVSAVLLGLYLVLFFVVRHADAVIRTQELQRRRDEESLLAARQELARSEQFHRALIEHASDAVLLLGEDFKVRYAAPADVRVLGVPESGLVGLTLVGYACEEYRDMVGAWLKQVAARPGVYRVEFEANHNKEGRRHFVATATNLCAHPAVQGIVVNIRDDTEHKIAELQVRRHALYDGLTGLARRDFFVQLLRKAVAHAARHKDVIAVMFLDLDGFKQVNDKFGHDVGDLLLREVAARMRSELREDDTIGRGGITENEDRIARLGGDEFTLLLTGLGDPANAALVAHRMLESVSAPYKLGEIEARVTTSIGIAIYPRDGSTAEDLLKCADTAMYAAKQQGKNTFRFCGGG